MASLPKQRIGIYVYENQPWELAFLHAWRVSGHGEIYGVPHTTVRFWDLRYHRDPRCYMPDLSGLGPPLPDRLAVNGPLAKKSLLGGGYPQAYLYEVEALRFLHLQAYNPCRKRPVDSNFRVLVCCDFLADNNARLFAWLEKAAKKLPASTAFLVKSHPAFPIQTRHYPALTIHFREEPIGLLLGECNVVFAGNTTSAALDALCAGIPVVQMMDGRTFNMSPLRGQSGVVYVESPEELADALRRARPSEIPPSELFNFDMRLVRWKRLLRVEESSQL